MLQTSAPIPLWLELTKSIIGPLIAAIFVVIGLIWRDRIERRNAAQAWYEQTYITEGLDVIISHLAVLCHAISEGRRVITDIKVTPLPSAVSRRLFELHLFEFLSGVETAEGIILASARSDHPIKLAQEESDELLSFCIALSIYADSVRVFLLNKKITIKSDVYKIVKDPKFTALTNDLQDDLLPNINIRAMNADLKIKYRPRLAEAAHALKGSNPPPPSS